MADRDVRDLPLAGDPERERIVRERVQALEDEYYAAFSAWPGVLTDLKDRFFYAATTLVAPQGVLDIAQSVCHAAQRDVVGYIVGMAQGALLRKQGKTEG